MLKLCGLSRGIVLVVKHIHVASPPSHPTFCAFFAIDWVWTVPLGQVVFIVVQIFARLIVCAGLLPACLQLSCLMESPRNARSPLALPPPDTHQQLRPSHTHRPMRWHGCWWSEAIHDILLSHVVG